MATAQRLASVEATQSSLAVMEEAIHDSVSAKASIGDVSADDEANSPRGAGQCVVMGRFIGKVRGPLLALTDAAAAVLDVDASDDLGQLTLASGAIALAQAGCESAWASFDAAYYLARRDIYYPDAQVRASSISRVFPSPYQSVSSFGVALSGVGKSAHSVITPYVERFHI
jgi:hypothetical protein